MNKPSQPKQHPDTPPKNPAVHPEHAPNGIPDGADADAKGAPISDRQDTETAAEPKGP